MIDDHGTGEPTEDYLVLLKWGAVEVRQIGADRAEDWRRAIRAKCRADRITVRTAYLPHGRCVLAWRPGFELPPDLRERVLDRVRELFERTGFGQ